MKTNNISLSVALSALIFAGCTDLDTMPEDSIITSDQKSEVVASDPTKSEASVNAIFSGLSQRCPNSGALGADRHNDFGYPSIMLFTEANGFDFIGEDNGYNWTSNNLSFDDRLNTSNESQIVWNDLYSTIYTANSVSATIDPETEDPTSMYYLAQSLAARAFCYLNLAQLYQFNYVGHQTSLCVPIITDENAESVSTNGAARATVEEVYQQINTDITTAINLLTIAAENGKLRSDKRFIDLATAYGIRARMNLAMQKWEEAASDADNAIKNSTATPASIASVSVPTFWSASETNWMWGILIAETDGVVTSGIVNWISHMGSLNYGYANYSGGFRINSILYESISSTDVRKGWWLDGSSTSPNLNADYQSFVDEYKYAPYTQVKFAPYKESVGTSTNANDIPLMRIEEMYLIKAEGLARSGGDGVAVLNSFVKTYRDPSYICSYTGDDLYNEIYRQRRIELWGEGFAWFDIMRLGIGVDRRGAGYQSSMTFNIESTDNILLWRISEAEIQANKAISESDNNPSASVPTPVTE